MVSTAWVARMRTRRKSKIHQDTRPPLVIAKNSMETESGEQIGGKKTISGQGR
jgi:hypothetical protein